MERTLASIVTPLSEGGIGVIQVIGPLAIKIVNNIFKSRKINSLEEAKTNTLSYGFIYDGHDPLDEVIINIQRKEEDAGGEDVVEINCHGGVYLVKRVFELITASGAYGTSWVKFAQQSLDYNCTIGPCPSVHPVESARQSLDLIQKEALLEISNARTKLGVKIILDQYIGVLSSSLSDNINQIDEAIYKIKHCIQNNLQYTTPPIKSEIYNILLLISANLKELIKSANFGLAITCPEKIVIIGKSNVGKSTLINALLCEDRVIVHPEPGTTRDPVSELVSIKGIPFKLIDTAGIRKTDDLIEKQGIEITKDLIKGAKKVILVFDNSVPLDKEDMNIISILNSQALITSSIRDNCQLITVLNKVDLPSNLEKDCLNNLLRRIPGNFLKGEIIPVSAACAKGISELEEEIVSEFQDYIDYVPKRPIIFKERQLKSLSEACKLIDKITCLIEEEGYKGIRRKVQPMRRDSRSIRGLTDDQTDLPASSGQGGFKCLLEGLEGVKANLNRLMSISNL